MEGVKKSGGEDKKERLGEKMWDRFLIIGNWKTKQWDSVPLQTVSQGRSHSLSLSLSIKDCPNGSNLIWIQRLESKRFFHNIYLYSSHIHKS